MQHHLFIWFEDAANGGQCAARGFPESALRALPAGRVLEHRYCAPGMLTGLEVTFLSNGEGVEFSASIQQLAIEHGTRAWIRGVDYLSRWRECMTLHATDSPVQIRRFFDEPAIH